MKCKDCNEAIMELERRTAVPCTGCKQPLHAECVMYSQNEDPYCEPCHRADAARWRATMKAQGATA